MELKNLVTFKTILQEGSFAKAAQRLNYTQSAITIQMRQLERELSVCLFEKVGRSMVLTEAGRQLIPYVEELLQSLERLQGFQQNVLAGDVRLGVAESLLCYKLPGVLRQLQEEIPGVRLFLYSLNCDEIRAQLLRGELDLGIFYDAESSANEHLLRKKLGEYPVSLVASARVAQDVGECLTPERRLPYAFITNEKQCVFRRAFEEYLAARKISFDHTIELWSIPTIKELLKNNMGVSYLPRFTVEKELAAGELVEVPTAIEKNVLTAVCAYRRTKWVSPLLEKVLGVIERDSIE